MAKIENLEGKVYEFSSEDIILRRDYADLGDAGDFYGDYLKVERIIEGEDNQGQFIILSCAVSGTWIRSEYNEELEEYERIEENTILYFDTEKLYDTALEDIERMSAGEIFQKGWDWWNI